jgi:hypothetical protein
MRKTSFIMISIFVLMCCNGSIYQAYGGCVDECKNECNTNIDKKYRWGEGYLEARSGTQGGRDGLQDLSKSKELEKEKCYATCKDTCAQNTKEKKAEKESKAKKE